MTCPNCGAKLTFMGGVEISHQPSYCIELQYNCEECTYDWKWYAKFTSDMKLSPIYWG